MRTTADPTAIVRTAQAQVHAVDPNVPVSNIRTLDYMCPQHWRLRDSTRSY